ncbi:MAG: 16S rRNA (uracil(1498)-N(3))-methyltransferase [Vulcanimicrobiaceae bacterium]
MHAVGDLVRLPGDDARKLLVVLRAQDGDAVEIVDSGGRSFAASLAIDGTFVNAALRAEIAAPARTALAITLAQGIPKGQKMDFVVEKATELGLRAIVPFVAARTVGAGERTGKLERWRRLAKSAAQQCGRADVPDVAAPFAYADLLATFAGYDAVVVPWELADAMPLRERLPELLAGARTALVAIGPEGGFSSDEARAATEAGGRLISLGSRILRTETAGLVAATAMLYASGDL